MTNTSNTTNETAASKPVVSDDIWSVRIYDGMLEHTAEFDTEENARKAWHENQPSMLIRTRTDHFLTGEVLEQWEAREAQDGTE